MDTKQLECFIVTARTLSFAKTANELFVTPSTVSYQIAQLEQEFGVTLIERRNRALSVSEAGRALLDECADILEAARSLADHARQESPGGKTCLTIKNASYFTENLFTSAMISFVEKNPGTNVRISLTLTKASGTFSHEKPSEDHDGGSDIIIYPGGLEPPEAFKYKATTLYSTVAHAVMSERHPLAARESVDLHDLQPYVIYAFDLERTRLMTARHWRAICDNPDSYRIKEIPLCTFEEFLANLALSEDGAALSHGRFVNLPAGLVQIPLRKR